MGSRGPAPTSKRVLKLRGSWRAGTANDPATPDPGAPTPPRWLSAEAKAEWRRIVPALEEAGLLSKIDRAALTILCQAWAEYVDAAEKLKETGEFYVMEHGQVCAHPLVAIRDVAAAVMKAFNFKGGLSGLNAFVEATAERMSAMLAKATPVIQQIVSTVVSAWGKIEEFTRPIAEAFSGYWMGALTAMWGIASSVWDSIVGIWNGAMAALGLSGSSFGSVRDFIVAALVTMEYGFRNWDSVLALAMTGVQLGAVKLGNQVQHIFTTVVPAVIQWAWDNWKDIFTTWGNFTGALFKNIGKNIKSAMEGIWDFISSGGSKGLNITWTPLTEGFESTIKELPNIAEREISGLEAQLQTDFNALKSKMTGDFETFRQKRMDEIFGGKPGGKPDAAGEDKKPRSLADIANDTGIGRLLTEVKGFAKTAYDGVVKFSEDARKKMQEDANAIKDSLKSPADRLAAEIKRIDDLQTAGLLTKDAANAAKSKIHMEARESVGLTNDAAKFQEKLTQIDQMMQKGIISESEAMAARNKAIAGARKDLGFQEAPRNAGKALEAGTSEAFSAANSRSPRENPTEKNTAEMKETLKQLLAHFQNRDNGPELTLGGI